VAIINHQRFEEVEKKEQNLRNTLSSSPSKAIHYSKALSKVVRPLAFGLSVKEMSALGHKSRNPAIKELT